MNTPLLLETVSQLFAGDKGLLAMDESTPTCNQRFAKLSIPQTEEKRREYREMIATTPNLGKYISGAILYDETIRQKVKSSRSSVSDARSESTSQFVELLNRNGIIAGIKVDSGAKEMAGAAGEKITEGLDGLRERLHEYFGMGARFAKWRAVISIGQNIPSSGCLEANAHALARYAALCQEVGLVPIVEPEVLMDGNHTLEQCFTVTSNALQHVFQQLYAQRVLLEAIVLKPNMVVPGLESPQQQFAPEDIAAATVKCLLRVVPPAVPGIAFLSGGQTSFNASAHLNAMNLKFRSKIPWALTFSFARAIQQPALEIWKGDAANVARAQAALCEQAMFNSAARRGAFLS